MIHVLHALLKELLRTQNGMETFPPQDEGKLGTLSCAHFTVEINVR